MPHCRLFKLLSLKILPDFPTSQKSYLYIDIQPECWIDDFLHWQHKHRPTVDDLHSKTFLIQDSKLKVDFLDTSGDDEVRVLIVQHNRYSANFLNLIDVQLKESRNYGESTRYFGFPSVIIRIFKGSFLHWCHNK